MQTVFQIEPDDIEDRADCRFVLFPKLLVQLPPTVRRACAIDIDEHDKASVGLRTWAKFNGARLGSA